MISVEKKKEELKRKIREESSASLNQFKTDNNINYCFTCGGKGFPDKKCPECGMEANSKSFNLDRKPEEAQRLFVEAKNVLIPQNYMGISWDKDILLQTHPEDANSPSFIHMTKQLEKIHEIFATGILPNKSAIIISPPQTSKVTWAYSCMQNAIMHKFKVAPMFDSQEVKRLITLAAERPLQKVLNMTYEEYIESDVVFVTITKTTYREEAYQVIEELLDKRSRRGLPTFFISRYSLETMSKRDWNNSFDYIKDYNNTENSLKYPVIINNWKKEKGYSYGV
jgi:hypothetical protein